MQVRRFTQPFFWMLMLPIRMPFWVLRWIWPKKKKVQVFINGVEQRMGDVVYKDDTIGLEIGPQAEPASKEPKIDYRLEIINKDGYVVDSKSAIMTEETEGFVCRADFHINKSTVLVASRVYRERIFLGERAFNPHVPAQYADIIKVSHTLIPESVAPKEPEPSYEKNADLRRIQLMTAHSARCAHGEFPPNHFALLDGDYIEDLGEKLRVRYNSSYPKAIDFGDPDRFKISYDPTSKLFNEIIQRAEQRDRNVMHGMEYIFDLNGELVKFFCGSRGMRRQSRKIKQVEGCEHLITVEQIVTAKYVWHTAKFTPVVVEWMGIPLEELEDGRLWNIIQAINTGAWANGNKVRFNPTMRTALIDEYQRREEDGHYTKKKVKKIKKKNKAWEKANA